MESLKDMVPSYYGSGQLPSIIMYLEQVMCWCQQATGVRDPGAADVLDRGGE